MVGRFVKVSLAPVPVGLPMNMNKTVMHRIPLAFVFALSWLSTAIAQSAKAPATNGVQSGLEALHIHTSVNQDVLDFLSKVEDTDEEAARQNPAIGFPQSVRLSAQGFYFQAGQLNLHGDRAVQSLLRSLKLRSSVVDPTVDPAPGLPPSSIVVAVAARRPGIPVTDDELVPPIPDNAPDRWYEALMAADVRPRIRKSLRATGAIVCDNVPWLDGVVGSGVLVHEKYLLTNRHVALAIMDYGSASGELLSFTNSGGQTAKAAVSVDFARFYNSDIVCAAKVLNVAYVSKTNDMDIALLTVGSSDIGMPEPLQLAEAEPPDLDGRVVWANGYPAVDKGGAVPDAVVSAIFGDPLGVKRLSPGKIMPPDVPVDKAPRSVLKHDCSTLGGNSGSPVVDLETGRIIGLHFAGGYRVKNLAVPAWRIWQDAEVKRLLGE